MRRRALKSQHLPMNGSQRFLFFPAVTYLIAAAFQFAAPSAEAELLAGWDFQGSTAAGAPIGTVIFQPPNTPKDFTSNSGVFQSLSHLYFDGTNGSSNFFVGTANADSELGALNGINANTAGTNFSLVTNQVGSLALFNRAAQGGIDGKSAVFKLSMDGYQDLGFSFAVQRPSSTGGDYGVSMFTFTYSTDGSNFLPWGSIDTGFGLAVSNTAFTLGPILQNVNDADTVFIKMTVSGSTGGINSTRMDNIQFNATAIPEPGVFAALLPGIGVLFSRRRRHTDRTV
jgi:hypothetical protein